MVEGLSLVLPASLDSLSLSSGPVSHWRPDSSAGKSVSVFPLLCSSFPCHIHDLSLAQALGTSFPWPPVPHLYPEPVHQCLGKN